MTRQAGWPTTIIGMSPADVDLSVVSLTSHNALCCIVQLADRWWGIRYMGYNRDLVDRFVNMGFDVEAVVDAFGFVGIDRNGGQDYELEEAYMGDITARLLGEQ